MRTIKKIIIVLLAVIFILPSTIRAQEDVSPNNYVMIREKVMAKDTTNKTLNLELQGNVKLADNCMIYQITNGTVVSKSLSDIYVGTENVNVYLNKCGQAYIIIMDGENPINNMRIGIMNNAFTSLYHDKLEIKSINGFTLKDKISGQIFNIEPDKLIEFTKDTTSGVIKVVKDGIELYKTANRLYLLPVNDTSLLQIMTFKRAQGNPLYRGVFEITMSPVEGKLTLINELQLEDYLKQVVPSEMPANFGTEALKAQAVAARTYALGDYYGNRFAIDGFAVVDSTLSQVYNNVAEAPLTTQAVETTKGMIMRSGNELVDARYYSTSGGYGASKNEVWSDAITNAFPGTPIPYLTAKSYTYDPIDNTKFFTMDTSNEDQINAFYKNLSYKGYDSNSYYSRWKVGLTKQEFENSVNANIIGRYAADPNFILTKDENGNFVNKPIPAEGIGTLNNMYVTKRGAGGNMMELVIEGSTGTYKIIKEFNIRFTIRPSKTYTLSATDVLLYRAKGGSTDYDLGYTVKNSSILPSAFCTFDILKDTDGNISNIVFYGGGSGHGVGMSQYGASALASMGWSFDKILNSYYSNMNIVDVNANASMPINNSLNLLTSLFTKISNDAKEGLLKGQFKIGSKEIFNEAIKDAIKVSANVKYK